jgi:MFS family permease
MGWVDMPAAVLIFVMSLGGLLNGMIQPSRDMMVRAVTPPGSFGKVFGFVTTGFNLGGMVAPLIYAWLMDHGQPRMIYCIVVLFILLALVTCMTRRKPEGAPHGLANAGSSARKRRLLPPLRRRRLPPAGPWNDTIAPCSIHRSVRGYKPDPLPAGTLETLIAAAQSAPPARTCNGRRSSPSPIPPRKRCWPSSPATRSTSSNARSICAGSTT